MTSGTDRTPPEARLDARAVLRGIALFAVMLALVILAVSALPGIGEVRDRFAQTDGRWLIVAGVSSLASMLGFVAALRGAFDGIPPLRVAIRLGFAEQGTNVLLPAGGAGGPAFGTAVMRRAGVPPELAAQRHVVLFLVTSGVSFGGLVVAGTLAATGILAGDVGPVGALVPAGAGAAVLATALLFARLGEPAAVPPASGMRRQVWRLRRFLHAGVRNSLVLIRRGHPSLVFGAIGYYTFDIAALGAAFQAFGGGGPALWTFVLAYTIGHAGALIPTPGGVGGTDGGLIGMFVVYGTSLPIATAAVLGYRVFQLGLPVVLGGYSVLRLRYTLRHGPSPEEVTARIEAAQAERGTEL